MPAGGRNSAGVAGKEDSYSLFVIGGSVEAFEQTIRTNQ
jgi:hypothetical protein